MRRYRARKLETPRTLGPLAKQLATRKTRTPRESGESNRSARARTPPCFGTSSASPWNGRIPSCSRALREHEGATGATCLERRAAPFQPRPQIPEYRLMLRPGTRAPPPPPELRPGSRALPCHPSSAPTDRASFQEQELTHPSFVPRVGITSIEFHPGVKTSRV